MILRRAILPSPHTSSFNNISIENRYGFENAAYISDEWKVSNKLDFPLRLRLSGMFLLGPGTFNTYDAAGNTISFQNLYFGATG